uniref:Putative secreted peptide n=1 Tax=Anopheles braziliensis TaxID=58242 RepID=A0A2M3ZWS5_9DIPT
MTTVKWLKSSVVLLPTATSLLSNGLPRLNESCSSTDLRLQNHSSRNGANLTWTQFNQTNGCHGTPLQSACSRSMNPICQYTPETSRMVPILITIHHRTYLLSNHAVT